MYGARLYTALHRHVGGRAEDCDADPWVAVYRRTSPSDILYKVHPARPSPPASTAALSSCTPSQPPRSPRPCAACALWPLARLTRGGGGQLVRGKEWLGGAARASAAVRDAACVSRK